VQPFGHTRSPDPPEPFCLARSAAHRATTSSGSTTPSAGTRTSAMPVRIEFELRSQTAYVPYGHPLKLLSWSGSGIRVHVIWLEKRGIILVSRLATLRPCSDARNWPARRLAASLVVSVSGVRTARGEQVGTSAGRRRRRVRRTYAVANGDRSASPSRLDEDRRIVVAVGLDRQAGSSLRLAPLGGRLSIRRKHASTRGRCSASPASALARPSQPLNAINWIAQIPGSDGVGPRFASGDAWTPRAAVRETASCKAGGYRGRVRTKGATPEVRQEATWRQSPWVWSKR
jgi:hypothetical protein